MLTEEAFEEVGCYSERPLRGALDAALALRAALQPMRAVDSDAGAFVDGARVTTVRELVGGSAKVDALSGDTEPHLLLRSDVEPRHCMLKPLFDYPDVIHPAGVYVCDVREGEIGLSPDTLIYWR